MDNPYEGNYYQPYKPVYTPEPETQPLDGNKSMATASLVMGILSILSICCFPPFLFVFAGLGILFSCLAKGRYARSGTAKAGLAISTSCLAIMTALVIFVCAMVMASPFGRSFFEDYFNLLMDENTTTEDIYDFLDKYLSDENLYNREQLFPGDFLPDEDESDFYFEEDELPDFYYEPETTPDGNFI